MTMRALVTGASGFVGRHLADHLRAEGDDVVGVDRVDGGLDITDPSGVLETIGRVRPDVVYHLAGWSDVGGSWAAPLETLRSNAEGTLNVLQACSEIGVDRVVAVSSADVYGVVSEDELPLTELAPLRPVSPYAASKVAADFIALQAFLGRKLGVLRVRAFNHIGPGQSNHFVASALAERVVRCEREHADALMVGNVSPRRDFTDVRDVVRAYRLLALRGTPGEVYNVCSGGDISIGELADRLAGMANRPLAVHVDDALVRPVDIPVLRGDYTKLQAATGWAPEIALGTTLADLLADWRQRLS